MSQRIDSLTIDSIVKVFSADDRVLFAYLYGSTADCGEENDIDIAVYSVRGSESIQLVGVDDYWENSYDLVRALHNTRHQRRLTGDAPPR